MNPTWPVYTFALNLASPQLQSWSLPYMTQPDGNETQAESVNIPKTFTSWIPGILPGPNIAQLLGVPGLPIQTNGHNGWQFTAYGKQATYLKKTYANGSPDDLLTLVS